MARENCYICGEKAVMPLENNLVCAKCWNRLIECQVCGWGENVVCNECFDYWISEGAP